jgi:hypothetical protein
MATLKQIRQELENKKALSAWDRGVIDYAWELFDNIEQHENYLGLNDETEYKATALESIMLNGAQSWREYSYGGCSYIYDTDIAQALCTPSELKRTDNGRKNPNKQETWLDVQARALFQASHLIKSIAYKIDHRKQVEA